MKHNKVWGMHRLVFPKHRLTFADRSALMTPLKVFGLKPPLMPVANDAALLATEPSGELLLSGTMSSDGDDDMVDDEEMAELVVN